MANCEKCIYRYTKSDFCSQGHDQEFIIEKECVDYEPEPVFNKKEDRELKITVECPKTKKREFFYWCGKCEYYEAVDILKTLIRCNYGCKK